MTAGIRFQLSFIAALIRFEMGVWILVLFCCCSGGRPTVSRRRCTSADPPLLACGLPLTVGSGCVFRQALAAADAVVAEYKADVWRSCHLAYKG